MKRIWIAPQSCKVCGSILRQQFPKENEYTFRTKCPNGCFDVIVEGDVHNVSVHEEGADHWHNFTWNDTFSGKNFDKVQKKINKALADAHKVWIVLDNEGKYFKDEAKKLGLDWIGE